MDEIKEKDLVQYDDQEVSKELETSSENQEKEETDEVQVDQNEQTEDNSILTFKLENYEGPLDLLVDLVKKNKMDIEDIQLSVITGQYLEIISNLSEVDMDNASDFIEWAAILIEVKSKRLLPKLMTEEEEEEDLEYLVNLRIKEYAMLKETTEKLAVLENTDRFYKAPEKEASKYRVVIKDMQLDMLLDAFVGIMHRIKKEETEKIKTKEVQKEKFTVEQKIASVKDALLIRKKIMFSELFSQSISREEVVTTFMALLELLKLQEISVKQSDMFQDISIEKKEYVEEE